jgi:hypothetical protein
MFIKNPVIYVKKLIIMLDGSLPKMCPAVGPFDQDGPPQPNLV